MEYVSEHPDLAELASRKDPVIEAYKGGIDRTLIIENLKLTPEQRIENLAQLHAFAIELRKAGKQIKPAP